MVADAARKPPAERSPLEIESIRHAMQLQDLGKQLKRDPRRSRPNPRRIAALTPLSN